MKGLLTLICIGLDFLSPFLVDAKKRSQLLLLLPIGLPVDQGGDEGGEEGGGAGEGDAGGAACLGESKRNQRRGACELVLPEKAETPNMG